MGEGFGEIAMNDEARGHDGANCGEEYEIDDIDC